MSERSHRQTPMATAENPFAICLQRLEFKRWAANRDLFQTVFSTCLYVSGEQWRASCEVFYAMFGEQYLYAFIDGLQFDLSRSDANVEETRAACRYGYAPAGAGAVLFFHSEEECLVAALMFGAP